MHHSLPNIIALVRVLGSGCKWLVDSLIAINIDLILRVKNSYNFMEGPGSATIK